MERFYFKATVKNVFEDEYTISVDAEDIDEARSLVSNGLVSYPNEMEDDSVKYCYLENREKLSSDIIELRRFAPNGWR